MRVVENYEIVISGEQEERLLMTFDWADLPHVPKGVSHVVFDEKSSEFRVTFEDQSRWEEVQFPALPLSLHDMVKQFSSLVVVGLSDKVELFADVALEVHAPADRSSGARQAGQEQAGKEQAGKKN